MYYIVFCLGKLVCYSALEKTHVIRNLSYTMQWQNNVSKGKISVLIYYNNYDWLFLGARKQSWRQIQTFFGLSVNILSANLEESKQPKWKIVIKLQTRRPNFKQRFLIFTDSATRSYFIPWAKQKQNKNPGYWGRTKTMNWKYKTYNNNNKDNFILYYIKQKLLQMKFFFCCALLINRL